MDIRKTTSGLLILTQLLPGVFPLAFAGNPASPFSADRMAEGTPDDQGQWQGTILSASTALQSENQSDALSNLAINAATGAAASQTEAWLSQFGTARVQLNVDNHGDWSHSAFDFLLPLYETSRNMLFTQIGYRTPDGRHTLNTGAGVRVFSGDWMTGANVFFDHDLTGHNRRVGIGAETWTNFVKLSTNSYFRLTDWHQSRDLVDYDERPADGWDIRSEAYLPAYPQLGGKLVYEQYYGNSVALVSKDERQRNPRAITVGLNWTPVPLVTAGLDYRTGSGSINDTRFSLAFRYQPGVSLREQLSPDTVRSLRSLSGSRHDLVERNNTIVLDYRKQELLKLSLPKNSSGHAGEVMEVSSTVTSKYAVKQVEWTAPALLAAGGSLTRASATAVSVTLPSWQSGSNIYSLDAVATDVHGNRSNSANTQIQVLPAAATLAEGSLTVTVDNALADGVATNAVQAVVTDVQGNPVAGQNVTFSTDTGAILTTVTGVTGADGLAKATLTSTTPGKVPVTARLDNGATRSVSTTFGAVATLLDRSLTVTSDNAPADGIATNAVQAKVTDNTGHPLPGQNVTFTAGNDTKVTTVIGTTGADGLAKATLTRTVAGSTPVTATLSNGISRSVSTTFSEMATQQISRLTAIQDNALADGVASNVIQATVTDQKGQPLSGHTVSFSATNGATVSVVTGTTGNDGLAKATLTSTTAGTSQVTASLANGSQRVVTTTFTPVAVINSFTLTRDNVLADGSQQITAELTVKDKAGHPLAGQHVTFAADNQAQPETLEGTTDNSGSLYLNVVSTQAGQTHITATLDNDDKRTVTGTFLPVATLQDGSLTVTTDNAIADGSAMNAVQAKVTDSSGHPVTGQKVTFTASGGATITTVTGTTGGDGLANATLTSQSPGTFSVTATLVNGASQEVKTHFVALNSIISIEAVDKNGGNANGKFFDNDGHGPRIAWKGAKFRVNTQNASSGIIWTVSSGALSVEGNVFTINSNPGKTTITGRDSAGNPISFTTNVTMWFAQSGFDSGFSMTAQQQCSSLNATLSSRADLTDLYGEWGNFSVYDGWTRAYYQTSTVYDDSKPVGDFNNWAMWSENGEWMQDAWGFLHYACTKS